MKDSIKIKLNALKQILSKKNYNAIIDRFGIEDEEILDLLLRKYHHDLNRDDREFNKFIERKIRDYDELSPLIDREIQMHEENIKRLKRFKKEIIVL